MAGMDRRYRRQLRWLISGRWDPRRGLGPVRGHIDWLARGASFGGDLGGMVLLLVTLPVWFPIALVGWVSYGPMGGIVGAVTPLLGAAFSFVGPTLKQRELAAACRRTGYARCPWCRHDLAGLPSDRCPECGSAVDLAACAMLYEMAYRPFKPDPTVIRRREKWAWARALRLRNGSAGR